MSWTGPTRVSRVGLCLCLTGLIWVGKSRRWVIDLVWVEHADQVAELGWSCRRATLSLTLLKMTVLPLVHYQSSKTHIFSVGRPICERSVTFESLRRVEHYGVEVVITNFYWIRSYFCWIANFTLPYEPKATYLNLKSMCISSHYT